MSVGGNQKFREFLSHYDLDNETIEYKYQTKAAEYYRRKVKACADEEEFEDPQPEYSVGRERIGAAGLSYPNIDNLGLEEEKSEVSQAEEVKSQYVADSDGHVEEQEETGADGKPLNTNQKRASVLLHEFFQSTIKVGEKGVEIVRYGGDQLSQKIDKNERAKKVKDTGVMYAKKGADAANSALNYAVDSGRYAKNAIYNYTQTEGFKKSWKSAVDTSKSAASSIGGLFSRWFGSGENNENNQEEEVANEAKPKDTAGFSESNDDSNRSTHSQSH